MKIESERLRVWADDLDAGTREQAEKTAALPIIDGHVALMADAHLGYGCAIGSVVPTAGAIIPSAAGVDLGCFRGDTLIETLSDGTPSLKEMAAEPERDWNIYAHDPLSGVVAVHARALKTRSSAPLVHVTLMTKHGGNGKEDEWWDVICTPDHEFLMQNETYVQASHLGGGERALGRWGLVNVVSVEQLDATEDVYCLHVPGLHNFALAGSGVFVHNCGMSGALTDVRATDLPDDLSPLLGSFGRDIPAGVGQGHDGGRSRAAGWLSTNSPQTDLTDRQKKTSLLQLGTLGSGNHFVEVSLDELDRVWVVLHSGSRGIGNQLAQGHIKLAKTLERHVDGVLVDPDLRWFIEGTPQFEHYIEDLRWAQAYALENREIMLANATNALFRLVGFGGTQEIARCHHNYAEVETHNGRDVWVTRKGAIRARKGDIGIIPGSMGTDTFIVEGLGNPDSYNSASHGAGRTMSRNAARKTLTLDSFDKVMDGRTWLHGKSSKLLDEHPAAYKDIEHVMSLQSDLVEVKHRLRSVLNYKGA